MLLNLAIYYLLVNLTFNALNATEENFKIVQTRFGKIEGKIHPVTRDDGNKDEVYEFRNIPYAQPPVGKLRWKPPRPILKKFDGVFKHDEKEVACKQIFHIKEMGQEDCLILTIRQPRSASQKHPLPVLFWIHGGGFIFGSSIVSFPDEQFSASMNMVTVSINYRLGMPGFLSVKETWSKGRYYGNYGIMDIIMALKWVKRNIKYFGGDPRQVTVLGESAGGAAIYSLITSPLARGLFNKAIPVSGYPVAKESDFNRAERRYGDLIRNNFQCTQDSSKEVAACLRNQTEQNILFRAPYFTNPLPVQPFVFPSNVPDDDYPARVLDGCLLPKPIGELTSVHIKGLKVLVGGSAHEIAPRPQAETAEGFEAYVRPRLESFAEGLYSPAFKLYKERRDSEKTSPVDITPQSVHLSMGSDAWMTCQNNDIAKSLSKICGIGAVYRFMVSQPFSFNPWSTFAPYAYHGIGIDALFGFDSASYRNHPLVPTERRDPQITKSDEALSFNMRKLVREFVWEDRKFHYKYHKKTIELFDDKILTWSKPYHERECKLLRDNGVLKRSFGQLNLNPVKHDLIDNSKE